MIVWPAKDPAEVLDYSWEPGLDEGDAITTTSATTGSGVTINSDSNTASKVTLWLSGGIDGETATFTLSVTTAGGRMFREVAVLPVFDRASELLALFRLRYGAFSSVADGSIGYWLADAARLVGETWRDGDRDPARLAWAAHMLAESGVLAGAIPAGVTSFRSGAFSATVDASIASLTGLQGTIYGREFLALRRASFAGPRLAWTPPAAGAGDYWDWRRLSS